MQHSPFLLCNFLQKGVAKNNLRKKKSTVTYKKYDNICRLLRRGNYKNIYLEKADFSNCNLIRANFGDAKMKNAVFSHASLNFINLSKASLEGADFSASDLTGANMICAKLKCANFENANLTGADLSDADLEKSFFGGTQTILKGAIFVGSRLVEAGFENAIIEGANFKGAIFSGPDLTKRANFNKASLIGANLTSADLTGATLIDANLAGADLRGTCLIGADLSGAHLEQAWFDGAVLKDAILVGAHLECARLINSELCGVDLRNAHLDGAILKGACLDSLIPDVNGYAQNGLSHEAILDGAIFDGADVSGAYLSVCQYQYARKSGAIGQPYSLIGAKHVLPYTRGTKALTITRGMREVVFGRYRQGKNGEVLPLRWRVLAVKPMERQVLLITEKLIDCRSYHNELENSTWADCNLRKWLNNEFLKEAFTEKERGKIFLTKNKNPANKQATPDGGIDTEEKIFLLSAEEVEMFFSNVRDRIARNTPWTLEQYRNSEDYMMFPKMTMGSWWLRSPGRRSIYAHCVDSTGVFIGNGRSINVNGKYVVDDGVCVRPALWLNL